MSRPINLCCLSLVALLLCCPRIEAQDPESTAELKESENVRVRLVLAKRSINRGQFLIAEFQTLWEKEPKTISVDFPAHSFTPHERTLIALINACCPATDESVYESRPAVIAAEFSMPDQSQWIKLGRDECLANTSLVRLQFTKDEK